MSNKLDLAIGKLVTIVVILVWHALAYYKTYDDDFFFCIS